ncbi:MAG: prolipoprotein diacylglyceryl transferase [Clostridiales bacterium]|nr:prolipoprotein diacylglyceryl transferase [Clostridiales bacterium]
MYPYPILFGTMGIYDLLLVLAVVVCLFGADRMGIMRKFSVKLQKLLIIAGMLAISIGLFGTVFFQAIYNAIETGKFEINANTGMTFYGGLIFGIGSFIAIWFGVGNRWCKNNEAVKQFGSVADMAACLIPLAHGLGRLGCLAAGCCHGAVTDKWYGVTHYHVVANGVYYETAKVVPLQLFEALFLFAVSGVMFWFFLVKFGKENKGRFPLLPVYAIVYGIWRFFIEYARTDDRGQTIISALSPSQLIAILMIAGGIAYLCIWLIQQKKAVSAGKNIKNDEVDNNGTNGSNETV